MPQANHLTQETHDRLQAELDELTSHGRTDIARKIQSARELGDLSENGDYHAAKEEQGKMEARIRQLNGLLTDVEIVEKPAGDVVSTGSVVTISYDGDDERERFLIGSIEERHSELDVISPASPLGQALLGAEAGSTVDFQSPAGMAKVEILAIDS